MTPWNTEPWDAPTSTRVWIVDGVPILPVEWPDAPVVQREERVAMSPAVAINLEHGARVERYMKLVAERGFVFEAGPKEPWLDP